MRLSLENAKMIEIYLVGDWERTTVIQDASDLLDFSDSPIALPKVICSPKE